MSVEPEFDRTLASWLDDGPTVLPEQNRRAIATSVRTIDQRRRGLGPPWRVSALPAPLRISLGAAAVLAVVLGGTYLLSTATQPLGVGGRDASSTAIPTATAPAPSTERAPRIGTITLYGSSCAQFGIPSVMAAGRTTDLVYGFSNLTETFGNFALYRLNEGRTWPEAEAWAAAAADALEAGEDLPPADFVTAIDDIDLEAGMSGDMPMVTDAGTYGFLCSSNEPPPGEIFGIYLVGPFVFE